MWSPLARNIKEALDALMKACNLAGESGTEILFEMLERAIGELEAEQVMQNSHAEGLCFDMNAAMALKLEQYITEEVPPTPHIGH